jgi:hypothetical protein
MPKSFGELLRENLRDALPNKTFVIVAAGAVMVVLAVIEFGTGAPHQDPMWAEILRTIGVGLIAAVVAGIIDHTLIFKNIDARIRDSLQEASGVAADLRILGVQNARGAPFSFSTIFLEAESRETVSWLDTYCPLQDEFIRELSAALKRNVSVRMMVIDPECDTAKMRSEELKDSLNTGEAFTLSLRAFIEKMKKVAADSGGKLEIRYYGDLPCVPMYLIGKPGHPRKGFFSIFLSKATVDCSHLELRDGEWLRHMSEYFEAKWERWAPKGVEPRTPEIAAPKARRHGAKHS